MKQEFQIDGATREEIQAFLAAQDKIFARRIARQTWAYAQEEEHCRKQVAHARTMLGFPITDHVDAKRYRREISKYSMRALRAKRRANESLENLNDRLARKPNVLD